MKFLHPFHEILFRNPIPDTGFPAKILPDGRDHDSVIIMSRINQGFRRKTENLFMNALIQHPGITLMEIGPPTTSDEQRIPAEKHPFQLETQHPGVCPGVARALMLKAPKLNSCPSSRRTEAVVEPVPLPMAVCAPVVSASFSAPD